MLPVPRSRRETLAFVDRITFDEALLQLVDATACAGGGLGRMRAHLASLAPSLPEAERVQAGRILRQWDDTLRAPDAQSPQEGRAARIAWLQAVARGRWDLRVGSEREQIPTSCDILPPDIADLVMRVACGWGMAGPMPARGAFDAAVVLGGQLISDRNRPACAADLLHSGRVRFPLAVGLACLRPLSQAERAQAPRPMATEADAMELGMEQAFGVPCDAWRTIGPGLRSQERADGLRLLVTHIPMDRGRRPDTGGSFAWLLAAGQLPRTERILSVTTPLYWIQNHANLLTLLPHGSLTTAGGTADVAGPARYRSQHYLQEIKSAVDVLEDLHAWACSG